MKVYLYKTRLFRRATFKIDLDGDLPKIVCNSNEKSVSKRFTFISTLLSKSFFCVTCRLQKVRLTYMWKGKKCSSERTNKASVDLTFNFFMCNNTFV